MTMDAWFYGVYATITEAVKLPIEPNEDMNHQLSAIVSSSVQDDLTDLMVRGWKPIAGVSPS